MPLDGQIYWWSSSVRLFAEAGEFERSSFHDVRFGETASEDSHSTFSFSGKRRQKLQAFRQLLLRDNRGNIYDVIDNTYSLLDRYYGTNFRSSVVFSWPGIDESNFYGDNVNDMTLSDIQSVFGSSPSEGQLEASKNRESCHTLSNVARMKDVTHPFIGIHKDKPLTLNTTKNYAGYYIVLERVRFYYDELYIRPIHAQVWSTFMDAPAVAVQRFFGGTLPAQYSWFDYYENGELGGHMIFGYNSNPCEEFIYRTRVTDGNIDNNHPSRAGEAFSTGDRVYARDDYYEDLDNATKLNILKAKGDGTWNYLTLYTLQYNGEKDIHLGPDGIENTEDDNYNFTQNAKEFVDNDDIIDVFYDRIPKLFTRAEVGENGFMDWTLAQTSHIADYYTYNEGINTWYTYWYYSPGQQAYYSNYVLKSVYLANQSFPLQTAQSNYFGNFFSTWTGNLISYSVQTPTMNSAADGPPSGWEINADDPFFYNDADQILDYGSVDRNRIGVVEWTSVPQAKSNDPTTSNPIIYDRQTTIDVEDAVIDPQYNRRIQTWTGSVLFKNLTLKIGSNVVNAQNDVYGRYNEMTNEQINNKSAENTPAIVASGTSGQKIVTFSNLYSYADKIKFYLEDNFLIVFDGDVKEYEINVISNSNTITLKDNLENTLTNSNFTLKIPRGSPNSDYTWGNYKIENFYDSWKEEVWPQNPNRHYDGMCEGWTRDEIIDASNPFDTTWKGTRPHKCDESETSYFDNRYGPWYDNEASGEPGTFDTTGGTRQLWYRFGNENKYRFFPASKTHGWLDSSRDPLRKDLHSATSYDYQCYTDLFNILSLGQKEGIIKMPKRSPFFSNEFTEQLMINHNYHGVAYWERMVPHANNGLFGGVASMSPTEHFIKNNNSERPAFISWDPCNWAKYWEKSFNARISRDPNTTEAQDLIRNALAGGVVSCPYNLYSLMAISSNYDGASYRDATDFKNSYNNQLGNIFADKDNNNVDLDFRVNEFFWGGLDPASSAIWPNYQNNLAKVSPLAFNYRLSQTYSVFSSEFTEAYGDNNPLIKHVDKPWFSFCASEKDPSVFQFMVSYEYVPNPSLALAYSMILNPTQNITSGQDHWWQTDINNDGRVLEKWAMDCWTGTNTKVDYVSVSRGSVRATGSSGSKVVRLTGNISAIQNKSDTKYFTFVHSGIEYDIITKSGNNLTLGTNLGATFNNTASFSIRNKRMPNQADLDSREDVKTLRTAWETLLHTKTKKNLLHPWCLAQYGFEPDLTGIMSYFTAEDDNASNGWYGNEQYSRKYGAPHIMTIYESNDILPAGTRIELNLHQASAPFNQELKDDVGVAIEDEVLLGDGRSTMPLDSYRLYVVAKFEISSQEFAEISKISDNRADQSTVADFAPEDLPRHDEGMSPGEFG